MTKRVPPSLPSSDSAATASSCPSSSSSSSASSSSDEEPLSSSLGEKGSRSSQAPKPYGGPLAFREGFWASEASKPYAAFGSFRQRNGDVYGELLSSSSASRCSSSSSIQRVDRRSGLSSEAPAKLESAMGLSRIKVSSEVPLKLESMRTRSGNSAGQFPPLHEWNQSSRDPPKYDKASMPCSLEKSSWCFHKNANEGLETVPRALPLYISHDKPPLSEQMLPHRRLQWQHHQQIGRSSSTDLDREEAWERKKELYLFEDDDIDTDDDDYDGSEDDEEHGQTFIDDDAASDPGGAGKPAPGFRKKVCLRPCAKPLVRARTRSLTDEDMEELRGSIDLGFGFSSEESRNLKNTLPALELYHAINRQYSDLKTRSTPASPLQGAPLARTISAGSTGSASSPLSESWRISSPGDHPSQVKTRLRHWAQAVACSIKQGY